MVKMGVLPELEVHRVREFQLGGHVRSTESSTSREEDK